MTIARFMKNTSISPSELLSIWDELAAKENSQVISELAPWLKSLNEMVFGLRLGGAVDVHGSWDIETLEQGVILAATQKDEISILARIEINAEKRMANLKVRSKGLKLRDTLMILLAEQLSGRTLTI